ncbi:MAG: amidase [Bacteroidota bacterium]
MSLIDRLYSVLLFSAIIFTTSAAQDNKITKENIKYAERIFGLEFTDTERDSMQDALNEQLNYFLEIHKVELSNSIMPSLIFNSIPTGFQFPKNQKPVKFANYNGTKLPNNLEDLAYFTIGQLAHLIKTKKISSTQLTRFYIDRLKKYDPLLHCVVIITEERALAEAKRADEEIAKGKYRGMLHGIPYGVKDLLATKTYKTTWGATPFKDQLINEDAAVIKKLEEAGAVLTAKLSMGALAWGDVWFGGKTRNPWDTSQGSSGSSAGSASSVSAGLLPFALGTETHGSIVSPSTVCGTTGLRPSYGRVSRTGAMALSWSMDKIGVITRYTDDLAIVFNVIKGLDGKDQTLYDVPFNYEPEINFKKLKIGYLKNDFARKYPFHNNDSIALKKFEELGAELIPIELPDIAGRSLSLILNAEAAAAFDYLTRTDRDDLLERQIKNAWPNRFRASRFISAVDYINANRVRTMLIEEFQNLFNKVDLYISPSWAGNNLLLTNLTGHPCVVLPNGFTEKGTPTSICIVGKLFDEGTIIAAAKAFQDVTNHHKMHPPLFK